VDPLYRQTSAKFDEGGANGLLMNNLGVYGRCRVLFDSLDVPGTYVASQTEHAMSDVIDLSFARGMLFFKAVTKPLPHFK
jgi:condensin complex subunit 2